MAFSAYTLFPHIFWFPVHYFKYSMAEPFGNSQYFAMGKCNEIFMKNIIESDCSTWSYMSTFVFVHSEKQSIIFNNETKFVIIPDCNEEII